MKRFLSGLLAAAMLLLLPACETSKPGTESADALDGYTVYPHNAQTIMYIKQARNPPKSIFTKPKQAVGVFGNMFKFVGDVVSVNIGEEYNELVLHTSNGYIKIIDLYSLLTNGSPSIATDDLDERFSIPEVGEKACIYAEYSGGNSDVFGCPVAYIGGKPTVARMTEKSTKYINSKIYKDYIPKTPTIKFQETKQDKNEKTIKNALNLDRADVVTFLENSFRDAGAFDGYNVNFENDVLTMDVWKNGGGAEIDDCENEKEIQELKEEFIIFSETAQETVGLLTTECSVLVMNLVDDRDTSRIILSTYNSEIVYDSIGESVSNLQDESEEESQTYILNTNTNKFHYSSCSDVSKIKDENKSSYYGTRADVIADGYSPCVHCNP